MRRALAGVVSLVLSSCKAAPPFAPSDETVELHDFEVRHFKGSRLRVEARGDSVSLDRTNGAVAARSVSAVLVEQEARFKANVIAGELHQASWRAEGEVRIQTASAQVTTEQVLYRNDGVVVWPTRVEARVDEHARYVAGHGEWDPVIGKLSLIALEATLPIDGRVRWLSAASVEIEDATGHAQLRSVETEGRPRADWRLWLDANRASASARR